MTNHSGGRGGKPTDGDGNFDLGAAMARTLEEECGTFKDSDYAYLDAEIPHQDVGQGDRLGRPFPADELWQVRELVLHNVVRTVRSLREPKDYHPERYGDEWSELERAVEDVYGRE